MLVLKSQSFLIAFNCSGTLDSSHNADRLNDDLFVYAMGCLYE